MTDGINLLQHAIGLGRGPGLSLYGPPWRNGFAAAVDGHDAVTWRALQNQGLARFVRTSGNYQMYYATPKGITVARAAWRQEQAAQGRREYQVHVQGPDGNEDTYPLFARSRAAARHRAVMALAETLNEPYPVLCRRVRVTVAEDRRKKVTP